MLIKPKYLPSIFVYQDNPVTAGTSVSFASGTDYATPVVDRSASPTFGEFVSIFLKCDAATPSGNAEIFVYQDFVGNTYSKVGYGANMPTTDLAPWYDGQVTLAPPNMTPKYSVASFVFDADGANIKKVGDMPFTVSNRYEMLQFNVAQLFGGIVPMRFAVLLRNKTNGALLGRAAGGLWCSITGVLAEAV